MFIKTFLISFVAATAAVQPCKTGTGPCIDQHSTCFSYTKDTNVCPCGTSYNDGSKDQGSAACCYKKGGPGCPTHRDSALAIMNLASVGSPKDCRSLGSTTNCSELAAYAHCGENSAQAAAAFKDGTGCSCAWGMKYSTPGKSGGKCTGTPPGPMGKNFCGTDWKSASDCSTPCTGASGTECPTGKKCFAGITCKSTSAPSLRGIRSFSSSESEPSALTCKTGTGPCVDQHSTCFSYTKDTNVCPCGTSYNDGSKDQGSAACCYKKGGPGCPTHRGSMVATSELVSVTDLARPDSYQVTAHYTLNSSKYVFTKVIDIAGGMAAIIYPDHTEVQFVSNNTQYSYTPNYCGHQQLCWSKPCTISNYPQVLPQYLKGSATINGEKCDTYSENDQWVNTTVYFKSQTFTPVQQFVQADQKEGVEGGMTYFTDYSTTIDPNAFHLPENCL